MHNPLIALYVFNLSTRSLSLSLERLRRAVLCTSTSHTHRIALIIQYTDINFLLNPNCAVVSG